MLGCADVCMCGSEWGFGGLERGEGWRGMRRRMEDGGRMVERGGCGCGSLGFVW